MLQVGDYITIKKGAPYTYTTYRSTGVVVSVSGEDIKVEFDFIANPRLGLIPIFWVEARYCKLTKRLSPQEKVCAKIKQMESRWLRFQAQKEDIHV